LNKRRWLCPSLGSSLARPPQVLCASFSRPDRYLNPSGKIPRLIRLWFAKTLADFEINDIAALPPLFCYNS
jgi:hypothetical protein